MAAPGTTFTQLKTRLGRLLPSATSCVLTTYRSSSPAYATEMDLLTGEGSKRYGGRWNPIGIATVYASLTPETALAETLAHHRYYGIAVEDAMPRTFVAIVFRLQLVLDLREGVVRKRLQVGLERMLAVDWRAEVQAGGKPLTQLLGRAAHDVGLEGLIVPSAADPDGHNLTVFPANLRPGSAMDVLHPDRLRN